VAPVAVLVDSSTASSAEAITIAFHGRPASRSFGSRTAGKSTAVQPFKLDDGAELYVTTAIDADRSGKAYPDGFTPDQVVSFNGGSMPQESNDQALLAAQTWLVASTTTVAPAPPAATLKTKLRHKKAGVQQNLASTPAPVQQPSSAPAVAAVQTPSSAQVEAPVTAPAAAVAETPIPAAVTPAAAPAAVVATAPAPPAAVAVTPVPEATVEQAPAPAPAAAVAQTPNSADVATPIQAIAPPPAPITPPPPTAAPAIVASTTPAAPPASAAPKPKVQHKKVVVHEGS
jgi:hypothetical protein